jgi:RecA-family ATPase
LTLDTDIRTTFEVPEEDREASRQAEIARIQRTLDEMDEPDREMYDYKGNVIPHAPPLKDGKPEDVKVARPGTLLDMMIRKGQPSEDNSWACYNVWKPGALTMVLGTQQSFKSWSMFDLMLHSLKGSDWFDHAIEKFDEVVYISNEKSAQAVYERMWLVFEEHREEAAKVHVRHRGNRIHFGNEAWKDLVTFLQEDLADKRVLLILDTLTSLAPPGYDENSLTHVSVVLEAIRDVQDENRVDVMLLHHLNAMGERPRGHTALDGEVDGFVRMNRRGRDIDEVLITFEPKDGMPSSGAFRFLPSSGTFQRATTRALHPANLAQIVKWWEERNNGEGITMRDLRDKFYTAHRQDIIERELDRAIEMLLLKREHRRNTLTNRMATLINTLSEEEREVIESRRRKDDDIVRDVEVEYNARMAVETKAEKALGYMPPDDDDDFGDLF